MPALFAWVPYLTRRDNELIGSIKITKNGSGDNTPVTFSFTEELDGMTSRQFLLDFCGASKRRNILIFCLRIVGGISDVRLTSAGFLLQKCRPNEHPRMKQCKAKRNVQFGGGVTYDWIYDPYYSSGLTNKSLSSRQCSSFCHTSLQIVISSVDSVIRPLSY